MQTFFFLDFFFIFPDVVIHLINSVFNYLIYMSLYEYKIFAVEFRSDPVKSAKDMEIFVTKQTFVNFRANVL